MRSMHNIQNKYDVVIGGAGITGLYAGVTLLSQGYKVAIVEASSEIGGRVQTRHLDNHGMTFEAGAGRFNNHHRRLLRLLRKYGLEYAPISTEKQFVEVPVSKDSTSTMQSHGSLMTTQLSRVIEEAKYPVKQLKQMTFGTLCKQILGEDAARQLQAAFGYDAEFDIMNAFDALRIFKRDFDQKAQYFYCKGGLSQLIHKLKNDFVSNGGTLFLNEAMFDVQHAHSAHSPHDRVSIKTSAQTLHAKCVILTFTQSALLSIKSFTKLERDLLESSVAAVPLMRIYAVWHGAGRGASAGASWFQDIPRTSTNSPIRQFIPIRSSNDASGASLAMASYSDTHTAVRWAQMAQKTPRIFKKTLVQKLEQLFPQKVPLPSLSSKNIYVHYWPEGVHVWRSGADSSRLYSQIMQIKGPDVPIFIIGETYSKNQGWIEGGLDMFHDALPKIIRLLR